MKRALLLLALLAGGCAHGLDPDVSKLSSNSDQLIWEEAQKHLDKKNWETARQYLKRVVEGFPQSQYGPAARLALADSYVKEGGVGNYILATSAFREFLTYYPSHPKSDYVQFMVAECFFKQKNGPDRDQTNTGKALLEYQRLLELYPQSSWVPAAKERIAACRFSLARADFLAGYFYQRTRQAYRAAILRYESLLRDYPDYRDTDEVLFRLGEALHLAGRDKEALPHLSRLIEEFPQSRYAGEAHQLLTKIPDAGAPPKPQARDLK